jgi:anthranilate synthase component I
MNATARIPTDLVTPLGAYLRLKRLGHASFLLESVEQGRLGRYSFVGCGSRLVSFDEAERETAPVVGYVGYDYVARLEPTVPLPAERPDLPESRFVVADVLVRIDHVSSSAAVVAGDPIEVAAALAGHVDLPPAAALRSHPTVRTPSREEHERRVRLAREHIVAGDAFQIVLSQRATRRTDASAVALYRSLRRVNPSPYLFLLELDDVSLVGSSPETHVRLQGEQASLNPIAGTIAVGE